MATNKIKLTVVDVGQGQCTFVEIYGSNGKLKETLLFDCGTSNKKISEKSDLLDVNLRYIINSVKSVKPTAKLDCLFLSHSDEDHINKVKYVLDTIAAESSVKKSLVKELWYCGARENFTKGQPDQTEFNIIDYIEEEEICETDQIQTLNIDHSDYNKDLHAYDYALWQSADIEVTVRALVGNILSDKPKKPRTEFIKSAEGLNRVSLVCALYFAEKSFVICGDATNKTMAAINNRFEGTSVFNANLLTTLPHHGSRTTGLVVSADDSPGDTAKKVIEKFSGILKSHSIIVSAYQKHCHPSLQLMRFFKPVSTVPTILRDKRLVQKNSHRITTYVDVDLDLGPTYLPIKKNTEFSLEISANVFSTLYYNGLATTYSDGLFKPVATTKYATDPINKFACWQFELLANKTYTLKGLEDLSKSLPFTDLPAADLLNPDEKKKTYPGVCPVIFRAKKRKIFKPAGTKP